MTNQFTLKQHNIEVTNIVRNAMPAQLYQEALAYEADAAIADTGALMVRSGEKPAAAPKINALWSTPILKTISGGSRQHCR